MAPRLNRPLQLQARERLPDGAGGFRVSWVTLGTLWASVEARSGAEKLVGGRMLPSVRHRIVTRAAPVGADARPRPDQRFVDGTRVYAILAVAETGPDGLYLECWAEEGSLT